MTAEEAAAQMNGREYTQEGTPEFFAELAKHDLVAVFGASDDNMEFEGKIRDEIGCYGGGIAYLDRYGLLKNDCIEDSCPYFERLKKDAHTITAQWDVDGVSWRYETKLPHATFTINEDGAPFCIGIVFSMDALRQKG